MRLNTSAVGGLITFGVVGFLPASCAHCPRDLEPAQHLANAEQELDRVARFADDWGSLSISAPVLCASSALFRFDPKIDDGALVAANAKLQASFQATQSGVTDTRVGGNVAPPLDSGKAGPSASVPASNTASDALALPALPAFSSSGLAPSEREVIRQSASDRFEIGLHRTFAFAEDNIKGDGKFAYIAFNVTCQPGRKSRSGYRGELDIQVDYDTEAPATVDRVPPRVLAVYPAFDAQQTMLESARRQKDAFALNFLLQAKIFGAAAAAAWAQEQTRNGASMTALTTVTSYSRGGHHFGYEFDPSRVGLDPSARGKADSAEHLESFTFPAVALVQLNKDDWKRAMTRHQKALEEDVARMKRELDRIRCERRKREAKVADGSKHESSTPGMERTEGESVLDAAVESLYCSLNHLRELDQELDRSQRIGSPDSGEQVSPFSKAVRCARSSLDAVRNQLRTLSASESRTLAYFEQWIGKFEERGVLDEDTPKLRLRVSARWRPVSGQGPATEQYLGEQVEDMAEAYSHLGSWEQAPSLGEQNRRSLLRARLQMLEAQVTAQSTGLVLPDLFKQVPTVSSVVSYMAAGKTALYAVVKGNGFGKPTDSSRFDVTLMPSIPPDSKPGDPPAPKPDWSNATVAMVQVIDDKSLLVEIDGVSAAPMPTFSLFVRKNCQPLGVASLSKDDPKTTSISIDRGAPDIKGNSITKITIPDGTKFDQTLIDLIKAIESKPELAKPGP